MLTDKDKIRIADQLEAMFDDVFMKRVRAVYSEIRSLNECHINNGNYEICNSISFDFGKCFSVADDYWDGLWFHPNYTRDGTFFIATKGLGEGCHFGGENSVSEYYNRFHDDVFGYHFHPTNWAGDCGTRTRQTAREFVFGNAANHKEILAAKNSIQRIADEVLPHLELLPTALKTAFEESAKIAKRLVDENDDTLRKEFQLFKAQKD